MRKQTGIQMLCGLAGVVLLAMGTAESSSARAIPMDGGKIDRAMFDPYTPLPQGPCNNQSFTEGDPITLIWHSTPPVHHYTETLHRVGGGSPSNVITYPDTTKAVSLLSSSYHWDVYSTRNTGTVMSPVWVDSGLSQECDFVVNPVP